jgi:hypothetical protein
VENHSRNPRFNKAFLNNTDSQWRKFQQFPPFFTSGLKNWKKALFSPGLSFTMEFLSSFGYDPIIEEYNR